MWLGLWSWGPDLEGRGPASGITTGVLQICCVQPSVVMLPQQKLYSQEDPKGGKTTVVILIQPRLAVLWGLNACSLIGVRGQGYREEMRGLETKKELHLSPTETKKGSF